jgi:glycosyltransferase involved in cell wall biosynthesis
MLSRIKKSPYFIVVYDLYPEVLVASGLLGKSSLVVKIWNFLNAKAYREALSVITIGKGLAEKLIETHKDIRSKIELIYPWADTESIRPLSSRLNKVFRQFNPEGKKVILYAGNMGISHDIESMVRAADLLKRRDEWLFLFVGGGEAFQFVENYKREKKLNNLCIHGFQPLELLPHLLSLASVSLVALEEGKQHLMVPSKLFYYLAAGSAVVGLCSGENDMQGIIESNNCGLCVPPGNPKALAEVLVNILDDDSKLSELSMNARSTAIEKFSKELGVSQFVENFYRCGLINKGEHL